MQLTVDSQSLANAIGQIMAHAMTPRTTLPVLRYVHLKSRPGYVDVCGTDLDRSLRISLPCEPNADIDIALDAKFLKDLLSKSQGNVTIEDDGNKMTLRAKKSTYDLDSLPTDDFPVMPDSEAVTAWVKVPSAAMSVVVASLRHACQKEGSSAALKGVYLELNSDHIKLTATDTHRLAHTSIAATGGIERAIIYPFYALSVFSVFDTAGDMLIGGSDSMIFLRTEDGAKEYATKQISGIYPNYPKVIPPSYPDWFTVSRIELNAALQRIWALAPKAGGETTLPIDIKTSDGVIELLACDDTKKGYESIDAADHTGSIELHVQSHYILDLLQSIKFESIKVHFGTRLQPLLITSDEDLNWRYVIMPINKPAAKGAV